MTFIQVLKKFFSVMEAKNLSPPQNIGIGPYYESF
jgi:hypothetical protein